MNIKTALMIYCDIRHECEMNGLDDVVTLLEDLVWKMLGYKAQDKNALSRLNVMLQSL